jgi:hypothetical protein
MFSETVMELFIRLWRKSDAAFKWVVEPGDPTQAIEDLQQILYALYYTATIACQRHLNRSNLTPYEVDKYIMQRASSHSAVFVFVSFMRWVEIILMVYECESHQNDGESYKSFLEAEYLLLPLFAGQHATKCSN